MLVITGLFTICSGGPVVYDTGSTGLNVSSYFGAGCSAFLDSAGDITTVTPGNDCGAVALLDEALLDENRADAENEVRGMSGIDDSLWFSPGGVTLSDTESMDVLSVFLLGDLTNLADINFVAPGEIRDGDSAARKIFAYLPSIPLTIAILLAGTTLILIGRLKLRRGSKRRF